MPKRVWKFSTVKKLRWGGDFWNTLYIGCVHFFLPFLPTNMRLGAVRRCYEVGKGPTECSGAEFEPATFGLWVRNLSHYTETTPQLV